MTSTTQAKNQAGSGAGRRGVDPKETAPEVVHGDPAAAEKTVVPRPVKPETSIQSQRQMADTLIRSLGHEAAAEACIEHGWYGVLGVILAERPGC